MRQHARVTAADAAATVAGTTSAGTSAAAWRPHALLLLLLLALLFIAVGSSGGNEYPRVETRNGPVRGRYLYPSPTVRRVEAFLGIRYADAPVGSLRFMPPRNPSTRHDDVWNATVFAPACPQKVPDIRNDPLTRMTHDRLRYLRRLLPLLTNQDEDCLFLNVYVPTT
ncbi:PREDICTED: neuroligin-4, X-linked-like, partial [Priapulus caudatus]|uniref:Neuroligin-4, X-linked-like n=1 Tax=Priapulus caudatus TaxID=37621 RepID=A0ABM1F5X0_PRICU